MIEVPLALAVGQWVLMVGLAVFIIVLYRQLAYLMQRKHGHHGEPDSGLHIGERVPRFVYRGADGTTHEFTPGERWTVLQVVDPLCVSCGRALAALDEVSRTFSDQWSTLAVTSSDPKLVAAVEEFAHTTTRLGFVTGEVLVQQLRSIATPTTYVVGPDSKVLARGMVDDAQSIARLCRDALRSHEADRTPEVLLPVRQVKEV